MKNKKTLKAKFENWVKNLKDGGFLKETIFRIMNFTIKDKKLNNFEKAGIGIGIALTPLTYVACVQTEKPSDVQTSGDQTPSGIQIESGNQTESGDQTSSGNDEITSGNQTSSGNQGITSGDETGSGEENNKAVPGDKNYVYPTTLAEIEKSEDKAILQKLLVDFIDENLKTKLVGIGGCAGYEESTKTIAYDIDETNNTISGYYRTETDSKIQDYAIKCPVNELDFAEVIKYQANKENNDTITLNPNLRKAERLFSIEVPIAENIYQKDAERVYKYLTGEEYENANYFAYVVGSSSVGLIPIVRTIRFVNINGILKISYKDILVDGYGLLGTENEKGYEDKGGQDFSFGSENTIYIEDIDNILNSKGYITLDGEIFATFSENGINFLG